LQGITGEADRTKILRLRDEIMDALAEEAIRSKKPWNLGHFTHAAKAFANRKGNTSSSHRNLRALQPAWSNTTPLGSFSADAAIEWRFAGIYARAGCEADARDSGRRPNCEDR